MKKFITIITGIILLTAGIIFAVLPKVSLKCDGTNCVISRNIFGQIIQAKEKFTYQDVQRCEVHTVKVRDENGQLDVKTFALRLIGDNIKYQPEWVKDDSQLLSNICRSFFKGEPLKYSDSGLLELMKNLWALFALAGITLISLAFKKQH